MTAWVWILIKMLPHLNWLFSSNISNFRENPFSGSALKLVFFKASQHFSLYENGHFCIFYLFSSTLHSSFDGKHFIVDKKKYIFEFTKQPTLNIAYSLPMNPNFQKWPNVRLPVHCAVIPIYIGLVVLEKLLFWFQLHTCHGCLPKVVNCDHF